MLRTARPADLDGIGALLDETLVLDGLEVPAGQVELVATHRDYEGRGLVRALIGRAHERSAARGQLVNVMLGIPYSYRRFGHTCAIPVSATRPVTGRPDAGRHALRTATAEDIPAMARLQGAEQARADLSAPHSPGLWRRTRCSR